MAARLGIALIAAVALVGAAMLAAATAQPYGPGSGMMGPGMMGPGMGQGMMGSRMMGRRGSAGMCNPAAAGFAEWRTDRIADLVKPTDAQRGKFDEFKAVSIKSAEMMRDACQTEIPATILARTEAMEKRMDTMLQAIRAMRPALEAFYATLSDEQKARLDSNVGRGKYWRWRDHW
jgi:hypothetical protein